MQTVYSEQYVETLYSRGHMVWPEPGDWGEGISRRNNMELASQGLRIRPGRQGNVQRLGG